MGGVVAGIAGAGAGIASGIMGANAKKSAANKAAAAKQQAADQYEEINIPEIDQQLLELERIKYTGDLTPEQEQAIEQKESELKAIKTSPELRDAQLKALRKLQQVGDEGGLTAIDKAKMNEIMSQAGKAEQANRAAVLQNFQARGMGGSGLELAAQLAGNQSAAEQAGQAGFNVASEANKRALDAIMNAGQLGGQIRGQEFGEEQAKASAQDAINRFNAANQQEVMARNVGRSNQAQERNLNARQQIEGVNTTLANQQQVANKGLYQQRYENELAKAKGKANALGGVANAQDSIGNANANFWEGLGAGANKLGTQIGSYMTTKDDKDQKKDEDQPVSRMYGRNVREE